MFDFLQGFNERMEFVAVVDSIVNRRNRSSEIESIFEEHQLDNIIVSVLVYIMEKTLTEDEDCTIDGVADFLKDILPYYEKNLSSDEVEQLARYIIKDILQNKGETRYYNTIAYPDCVKQIRIRLITDKINKDNKVVFRLSDQGYNFLFRTKEVDKELGFTMEELKLRELIRRKNYKQAVSQSKELIRMLTSKREDLKRFEMNLKNSLQSIDSEEYERLINETHSILQQEYDIMDEIRGMIALSEKRLLEDEAVRGSLDKDLMLVKAEIAAISKNIGNTINLQRKLMLETVNLKKLYIEILKDALNHSNIKRFNFEEEILKPLETDSIDEVKTKRLITSLLLPNMHKTLNIIRMYERQSKLREGFEESESEKEDEFIFDDNSPIIRRKNEAYITLIQNLFAFASENIDGFRLSSFLHRLETHENFDIMKEDKLVFRTMLKLYEFQVIDIAKWKNEVEEISAEGNGEFDLSYCLYNLEKMIPDFYGIDKLCITKLNEEFSFDIAKSTADINFCEKITMNDLFFEVIKFERKEKV